jgi:hypothetical protein
VLYERSAVRLIERGYQADFFEVVEHINSSFANRKMVDRALGQCTGQSKERLDELFASSSPRRLPVRLAAAKVFVHTLGVAPAFFDRQSGEFVMPSSSALGSRAFAEMYDFRTTTVGQNLDNLDYIVANIKALNPDVKVVLTVSPVPLKTTFEFKPRYRPIAFPNRRSVSSPTNSLRAIPMSSIGRASKSCAGSAAMWDRFTATTTMQRFMWATMSSRPSPIHSSSTFRNDRMTSGRWRCAH